MGLTHRLLIAGPGKNPLGPRSGDLSVGVVMEAEWDALRVLGAVTALFLLLWATWAVGSTVYIYLLPQALRTVSPGMNQETDLLGQKVSAFNRFFRCPPKGFYKIILPPTNYEKAPHLHQS